MSKELLMELSKPFPAEDIEWRTQSAGVSNGRAWAIVIPYITNRAIQARLDEVFGLDWQNVQKPTPDGKGYLCGISVKVNDYWVTRYDGSEYTAVEPLKGALSGAMKRAGAQFGIGRYLYNLSESFAECRIVSSRRDCAEAEHYQRIKAKNGTPETHIAWIEPALPAWAVPVDDTTVIIDKFSECQTMTSLAAHFEFAAKYAKTNQDAALLSEIVKIKDQRKADINDSLTLNMSENYRRVETWLDAQIASMHLVSNIEALHSVATTYKKELAKRSLHEKFDNRPLAVKLDESIKQHLKTLENTNDAN